MEIVKARKLGPVELDKEITKTRGSVVELRAETAMHRVKNLHSLKLAKQYLARLLTIKREKEIINVLSNE